jgi:hypothetical protein
VQKQPHLGNFGLVAVGARSIIIICILCLAYRAQAEIFRARSASASISATIRGWCAEKVCVKRLLGPLR